MKKYLKLIVFIVAWACILHMTFFFMCFWLNGSVWIGEDNLWIRSIESVMLLFSLGYFSIFLYKYVWGGNK